MSEALQRALESISDYLNSGNTVTQGDLAAWRTALTSALERMNDLEKASRAVLDAYLLRGVASSSPTPSTGRKQSESRKQYMQRLATAIAALEKELETNS